MTDKKESNKINKSLDYTEIARVISPATESNDNGSNNSTQNDGKEDGK